MSYVDRKEAGQGVLIRLGGFALLLGFAIHILVNIFVKRMPPDESTLEELRAYLSSELDRWALVHGLRYVAIACMAVFAGAMFARTCRSAVFRSTGWGVIGLLGSAMLFANLMITNGIETFVFLDAEIVTTNADLFWAFFKTTRVLFTAEVVAWAILIGGFSVAGWLSSTLPRWLSVLGFVQAACGILSGVFVVSILADGWATPIIEVASLSGLLWFLCSGLHLLIRGEWQRPAADSIPAGT